ncbi:MAG TPA: dCTP deaminase [Acidobacteriota bacterium]|nr:dCTP deaminase [Acidobacteriota bacterium]
MGVKPDHWIIRMARSQRMIEPFEETLISRACVSYGVSSYGYDMRIDRHYKVFRGQPGEIIDPKSVKDSLFEDFEGDTCVVPPGSFVLGKSVEYFRIPRDILTICTGKSTYARCGLLTNITPFEPEWEGFVTVALFNTGPAPVRVYSGEGIAQVIFISADEPCTRSYRDRKGKYQAQKGIVNARIEEGI